ncbi:hypothetical protein TNIN_490161 [Trichonephila inaurata madagascariensis]|uniref:Uncharacterized protein n=1 Tax=Trichonephila inaurata madagascariensis TaxID=2747483 RepID=A0A8X6JZQ1_9ARAC|nr:hypothetical protein TNIN_490161 [Trichonephila inaurata madagascariensis]
MGTSQSIHSPSAKRDAAISAFPVDFQMLQIREQAEQFRISLLPANTHVLERQSPDTSHSPPICLSTSLHMDSNVTKPPPGSPQASSGMNPDHLSPFQRGTRSIWGSTVFPVAECNSLVTITSPTEPTPDMPPQPSSQRYRTTNQELKNQSPPAM